MTFTNKFATPEQKKELQEMAQKARETPAMLVGTCDLSATAWDSVLRKCHEYALAAGLPEIHGYYGMDADGQFVRE